MDSLYIRNYSVVAVVGMFCLLNTSVSLAQVGWLDFDPEVRARFITQEANIASLREAVADLEPQVAALAAAVSDLQTQVAALEQAPNRPVGYKFVGFSSATVSNYVTSNAFGTPSRGYLALHAACAADFGSGAVLATRGEILNSGIADPLPGFGIYSEGDGGVRIYEHQACVVGSDLSFGRPNGCLGNTQVACSVLQ